MKYWRDKSKNQLGTAGQRLNVAASVGRDVALFGYSMAADSRQNAGSFRHDPAPPCL